MEPSLPLQQSTVKAAFAARQARLKNAEALEAGVVEERAAEPATKSGYPLHPETEECENEYCDCHVVARRKEEAAKKS